MAIALDASSAKTAALQYRIPLAVVAGLALLAVFVLAQIEGGQTVDEAPHLLGLQQQIQVAKFILSGDFSHRYEQVIHPDYAHYGGLPVAPAYAVGQLIVSLVPKLAPSESRIVTWLLHANAFFYGLLTCFFVFQLVRRLTDNAWPAAVSATLLLLYPSWLGQSFFNYKDLPAACFFVLAVLSSLNILDAADDREFRSGAYGLVVATILLIGVKLVAAGLIVPAWLVFAYRGRRRPLFFGGAVAATLLGAYIITPQAWLEPVRYAFDNVIYMARHPWGGCTLMLGECIGTHSPNWSTARYLAVWFGVGLPVLIIVALPIALVALAFGTPARKLVAASLVFPLALIVGRNSTLYDGIRHVLFVVPILFIMTIVTLYTFWRRALPAVAVFYVVAFAADNIALFPYNYVYFNGVGRQIANQTTFDLEYWYFSSKQLGSLINKQIDAHGNGPLTVYPAYVMAPYVKSSLVVSPTDLPAAYKGIYYTIVWSRMQFKLEPGCERVGTITRRLPLSSKTLDLADIGLCHKA